MAARVGASACIEHVRTCLLAELGGSSLGVTVLNERHEPPSDPNDDYRVVYEAWVEPEAVDQLRIELWVTDTGLIAVGLEKWVRVARLLGARTSAKDRFVTGHEPVQVPMDYIGHLVGVVASGSIGVRGTVLFQRLLHVELTLARPRTDADKVLRPALRSIGGGFGLPFGRTAPVKYRPW